MKKFYFLILIALCSTTTYAQLKVGSDGNVGIGIEPESDYKLLVDISGRHEYSIFGTITSYNSWGAAVAGTAYYGYDRQVGVRGEASSPTANSSGRAYGVIGVAGNRTSGYNYGVYGTLNGTNNGAGIFGTVNWESGIINGRYAGYFYGDTYITGTLTAQKITTLSDIRFKTNIEGINTTALLKLSNLHPVQYNLRPYREVMATVSDTSTIVATSTTENIKDATIHYGLIAQEVQEIYPELVHADGEGLLSINYIELIPLLIQSIQELSEEVETLKNYSSSRKVSQVSNSDFEVAAILYQNNPNPFSENTTINYELPLTTQNAALYIYDMTGEQLDKYEITTFGSSSITVNGGTLSAGMYLYSLIADGKVIDTKRMILTK